MIPTDIDPSLCTGEPQYERLGDGFSPPPQEAQPASQPEAASEPGEPALAAKSLF